MELLTGFPLLAQQYQALFIKNLLLAWRHKLATFLQLFSSIFFILLIFGVDKALHSRSSSSSYFKDEKDPQPLVDPPIPPCEDKFFAKKPCLDFVWSGNDNGRIREIVKKIRDNNPGRPIPEDKVKEFKNPNEADDWMFSNALHCPGALHFTVKSKNVISYGVQSNSTTVEKRGSYEDPTFKFQIPLQLAAEREIARDILGDGNFNWIVSLKDFAHPPIETMSAIQVVGSTFFLSIAMFSFVFQMSALVTEKELKLRQAMTMMGLYDTAYWLSWLTWEGIMIFLSALFTVLFGMAFQFDFFKHNSFAVVFLLFYLFQLNMTAFAFMLSTLLSKSSSSTTAGFFIFIVGFMTQLVTTFGFPYNKNFSKGAQIAWSFFPPNLLAAGLNLLNLATATPQDPGISWSGRMDYSPNDKARVLTMNLIYIWLLGTFFVWFTIAIYLDNVIPNPFGVSRSFYYFVDPGYWTGKGGWGGEAGGGSPPQPGVDTVPDDEDVREEENLVKKEAAEGDPDSSIACQIRGLMKLHPGKRTCQCGCCKFACGCCCRCPRTTPFLAVKGLWLNFPNNQLFCLLGHNGAGKTTTINCLTGITPVTGGDAIIHGYSVLSGMSNIRRSIGVCPQFDLLWNELTGSEHLYLFARMKGVNPSAIKSVSEKLLEEVKLAGSADVRSGSYSGGMKRRLSVAVALIGEPKLVILDEPTTGMDPITRRHVWDVIEEAKKGRAIILTTHSMEEADILSDRIGIMAKGRLRCIGTSIRLKSRFGTGFITNISFADNGDPDEGDIFSSAQHLQVKEFFKLYLDVSPKDETKSYMTFVIPHDKENCLKEFFTELQSREKEFGITDIQLGLTTLEEVFMNIAKDSEFVTPAAVDDAYAPSFPTNGHQSTDNLLGNPASFKKQA